MIQQLHNVRRIWGFALSLLSRSMVSSLIVVLAVALMTQHCGMQD